MVKVSLTEKFNKGYIKRIFDVLLWSSIIVYLFVMANLLLFKYISPLELFIKDRYVFRDLNFIPFVGIFQYLFGNDVSFNIALYNVVGNVLIFMPMGLLLQLMRPKQSLLRTVIVVCLSSIAVELIQYIMGIGSADIDDIILNTLGGLLGAFIFILLNRLIKNRYTIRIMVIIIAVICSIVIMPTQGKVWIRNYFREQINAELTLEYGMNLEEANIYGVYQSLDGNILTLVTDDGEKLTVVIVDETLISLVRRKDDGTIDVFEPIDTKFLAEFPEGLPIWLELSENESEAVKICMGDNPIDFEN